MSTSIRYIETPDSRFYKPADGSTSVIDVVQDMSWTYSPKSSRRNTPYVYLKEYQQTTGQLIASFLYLSRVATNLPNEGIGVVTSATKDPLEAYKDKYFAEPTGFQYKLPYFNPQNISRSNGFDKDDNPFSELVKLGQDVKSFMAPSGKSNFFSKIGSGSALLQAGVGIFNKTIPGRINFEFPKSWTDTQPETYSTTFDLFNTGTLEDVVQNRKFCHLISYQNTPSRRNFAIIDPPVIYSLHIPGIVDLPACYVSSLSITNLGNTRSVYFPSAESNISDTRTTRIIPEAYRITLTFESLLLPTRNIMSATETGRTVEVMGDTSTYFNNFSTTENELRQQVLQTLQASDESQQNSLNLDNNELTAPLNGPSRNMTGAPGEISAYRNSR